MAMRPYDEIHSEAGHGGSPFHDPETPPSYPPTLSGGAQSTATLSRPLLGGHGHGKHVQIQDADPARSHTYPGTGMPHAGESGDWKPASGRSGSWDMLAGLRKFENSYEQFDARNASEGHLAYADGDMPKNGFSKFYNYLLNVSIISRWALFILPVLGVLWIPGILGLTAYRDTRFAGIKLLFWSIWLSVVWCGWWASLAFSMIFPKVLRYTVGVVAVGLRKYIDWMDVLHRYIAFFAWALTIWISYQPLINGRQQDASPREQQNIDILGSCLFAIFLCAALLLVEKLAIQWIAGKFHERSYAERIADQKFAVRVLVTLYQHSSDIPGRTDTLRAGPMEKRQSMNPKKFFKRALKGVRYAATTTTTVLGNVASEIAGSSVLQPNSPQAMVQTALASANKTRLLARRLYYSFVRPGAAALEVEDVQRFFPTPEDADAAFAIFDKDSNGDARREEIEMACMDIHREQLSIEHSMRDLDSAVGRLDNILMSVYVVVAILAILTAFNAGVITFLSTAGTLVLGLSWLIGSSLAEVLTSIIFLFVKHPFDVGDRVVVSKESYTVKEIRLLSTIFLDGSGCSVQAPNTVLNGQFIYNIRRSPQMSEPFEFEVSYDTTFEQIEKLREIMMAFLKSERRDYQPVFDVFVMDIPGQTKMVLKSDIKYKSNSQHAAIKAQRRNKWICALKAALEKVKMYGPGGNSHASSGPTKYTLVPYERVLMDELEAQDQGPPSGGLSEVRVPVTHFNLTGQNIDDGSADLFGEADEMNMTAPRQPGARRPGLAVMQMPEGMPGPSLGPSSPYVGPAGAEDIELQAPLRRPGAGR